MRVAPSLSLLNQNQIPHHLDYLTCYLHRPHLIAGLTIQHFVMLSSHHLTGITAVVFVL
jgi:hypothetical protein